ncbi:MAG: DUF4157 domain-containing protein [Allosphingosinicella sp.]
MAQHAPPVPAPRAAVPAPVQAKLEVGPANDHYERQADSVATAVMRASGPVAIPPTISPIGAQRQAAPEPKPKEDKKKTPTASAGSKAQRKGASPPPKKEEPKKAPAARRNMAQRKAAPTKREEKKKPATAPVPTAGTRAQREAAAGAEGGMASASADAAIQAMRSGPASRLDPATQGFMESRFGRDFSGVRVHHGAKAAEAADAIGARAFTTGNDIFFNAGQYQPNSSSGRQLLAHELTHTVQQGGGTGVAARTLIQRARPPAAPAVKEPIPANRELIFTLAEAPGVTGTIKLGPPAEVEFPFLNLPSVNSTLKGQASAAMLPTRADNGAVPTPGVPYSITGSTPRAGDASGMWLTANRAAAVQGPLRRQLERKLPRRTSRPTTPPVTDPFQMPNGAYVLGFDDPSGAERTTFMWGTTEELAQAHILLIPRWSPRSDNEQTMDVDHILELQLGGADRFDNMWLLESSFNQQSGAAISGRITSELTQAVRAVQTRYDTSTISLPGPAEIRNSWKLTFRDQRLGPRMRTSPGHFWTRADIEGGVQLRRLKFLTSQDLSRRGFRPHVGEGTPNRIHIFPTERGGLMRYLDVGEGGAITVGTPDLYRHMTLRGGTLAPPGGDKIATLRVVWQRAQKTAKGSPRRRNGQVVRDPVEKDVDLMRLPGFMDVGYLSQSSVYAGRTMPAWSLPGASPVEFSEFGLNTEGALVGKGTLTATKALLPGLQAEIHMLADEMRMDFPIPQASFSLGPVTVTAVAMALGVNSDGPFVRGTADFEIASLGQGTITAEVSREGPIISGDFNLAMDFLDPARVAVSYNFADDTFSAQATLGVQQGKIPGVDSGQVTVGFTREAVSVAGTLNLGGPLRGTVINVGYDPTTGLRIGADNIPLPISNIPAIQNATMSLSATKPPEGEWSFAGRGQATLAVPGATGTIGIDYLNGALTFTAAAQIAKGPASGTLNFTATNRQIDEQGHPVEGPPIDGVNVWGRGSVTVRFGSILTGTAGVELTPTNSIILSGAIALPPTYELFPRRDYNRDLFTLAPPEFPIWGVSVAGVGVGVFAFVDARVAFNAYVGPGQIRNAQVGAVMDLDHPEDATITGHGEFYVPAYAGLTLDVGGGLRARAGPAYGEGRVGLTGALGIEAGAGAEMDINWSRDAGLSISADLHAEAQPKFELSANASITIGVSLLVTDVSHTFGPWRRQLGSFGPNMTLGVRMPVRWSEANGLDLSLDNIEVQRPSLDATELMTSVFDQLAG